MMGSYWLVAHLFSAIPQLTSFPIILMVVGATVVVVAIVPPAADTEEDVGPPTLEVAPVDDDPPPPGGCCCCGGISGSSRTESLSKLILTCDQRCVVCCCCCSFFRGPTAGPLLLVAVLSSLPSSDSYTSPTMFLKIPVDDAVVEMQVEGKTRRNGKIKRMAHRTRAYRINQVTISVCCHGTPLLATPYIKCNPTRFASYTTTTLREFLFFSLPWPMSRTERSIGREISSSSFLSRYLCAFLFVFCFLRPHADFTPFADARPATRS